MRKSRVIIGCLAALLATLVGVQIAIALTQTLTVSGNGGVSGWNAEGGDCTNLTSDDGVTSKLYSPSPGDVRVCALTDTSGLGTATINSLTVTVSAGSLDPVSNTFKICVRISGVNYCSADKDTGGGTSYVTITNTWLTNPATSAAWTTADLDALEAGLEKVNLAGLRWSYMIADVDYTASGGGGGAAPELPKPIMIF